MPSPYILHVGNNAWYKNRAGVMRIFATVRKASAVRLILVGPAPDRKLREAIDRLGLNDAVTIVTQADDAMLTDLYTYAALLLFPSRYEGFGWPPLEAMACGCPVVCSTAGSLAEVVGDAALTAAAADEDALARHCQAVLGDPELAGDLRARGRERARAFTLERMRADLLYTYRAALSPGTLPDRDAVPTGRIG